jgi:hypothetical protein
MARTIKDNKPITINQQAGEGKVELICIRNTFLPDGSFVGKDSRILVDSDFAERVFQEQNPSFIKA